MNATATQAVTATHPCACSLVVAIDAAGNETRTNCTATTKRTFAPGHDARLKGFLIRAGVEGLHIREVGLGVAHETTAAKFADRFGFGHMVRDGIANGQARKIAKKAPKAKAPKKVTAKVGRWFYEGTLSEMGRWFTYTDKKGAVRNTKKFTLA